MGVERGQQDFTYALAADCAGLPLAISIFADRAGVVAQMREDVELAGLVVRESGTLAAAADGAPRALGEVVLVDCPADDAAALAALCRLDERAARSGARMIVSASLDSLDAVFGCCTRSAPQLLVGARRTERVVALGRVLAEAPHLRLRELSADDRLLLLRITDQVGQIAERLDRFDGEGAAGQGGSAFAFGRSGNGTDMAEDRLRRATRPPLPEARLVRRIIQQRQLRARFLDAELFADPAWDMLLDLTAARVEHVRVSVTSLCIASGVPPTTALRWISQMTEAGLLMRVEDDTDRRRAFIQLTEKAVDAMARYFHALGTCAAQMA